MNCSTIARTSWMPVSPALISTLKYCNWDDCRSIIASPGLDTRTLTRTNTCVHIRNTHMRAYLNDRNRLFYTMWEYQGRSFQLLKHPTCGRYRLFWYPQDVPCEKDVLLLGAIVHFVNGVSPQSMDAPGQPLTPQLTQLPPLLPTRGLICLYLHWRMMHTGVRHK